MSKARAVYHDIFASLMLVFIQSRRNKTPRQAEAFCFLVHAVDFERAVQQSASPLILNYALARAAFGTVLIVFRMRETIW